jgi:MFS family permease
VNDRVEGAQLVRTGLILVVAGSAGMMLQLRAGVPVAEAFAAWAVGGFGMGLAYAPISLMVLRAAAPGREGWASASLNLADVLGTALGIGVGGAAVQAVARGRAPVAHGVFVAFAAAALVGLIGLAVSRRLPRTRAGATVLPVSR